MPLEQEVEGLVTKQPPPQKETKNSQFLRWIGFLILLVVVGLYMFVEKEEPQANNAAEDKERRIPLTQCPSFCQARSDQLQKHHGGDLLDTNYLVKAMEASQEKLHSMLKADYGEEAFKNMFVNKRTGRILGHEICKSADRATDISYLRFRRKLQMKALQVQMKILDQRVNLEGCNCTNAALGRRQRRLQEPVVVEELEKAPPHGHQSMLPEVPAFYERFVWGAMGHSAAAAHGNLYNESYAAFLERGLKDTFSAIGIDFEGRNYAMGGMDSAPQLSLCQEAVVGTDVDMISWDFGMTDGQAHWKSSLFASRVGMHVNRPTHMSINVQGRHYVKRTDALREHAEDVGIATLHMVPDVEAEVDRGIPDCFGMPQAEVDKHGPFASNFKCKGAIEKEEPCAANKYNNNICSDRKFKASWHPGWRQQAKQANLLALYMANTMVDALKDLVKNHGRKEPRALYAILKAEEDVEYAKFHASTVPDVSENFVSEELVQGGLKSHFLHRNKAICKTALLPAKSRYLGILTESNKKGDFHGFDEGIDVNYATKQPPIDEKDKGSMALVFDNKARQSSCPVDLQVDYKDYFYATQDWGWASLKFPNNAEIEEYAPDGFNPAGVVMLCFYKCDWGRCPEGEVDAENGIGEGKWKLELNGQPVQNLTRMDQCFGVRTKEGYLHKPNENGRYELRVWIGKEHETNFIRLTSIIVL
jgi:hypothetical protein